MNYREKVEDDLNRWKEEMQRGPSLAGELSRKLQKRINKAIPEKIHNMLTAAISTMTRTFLTGSELTTQDPVKDVDLEERERKVRERIRFYSNTAAAEGAITGAGGLLLGLADFPIWLGLKMKMLCEIAALYGIDVGKFRERIYILYIFELTFSSQKHRNDIFRIISNWPTFSENISEDINAFDWQKFQQEYRDYIDIAKLLQLMPGIGAAVGAIANHRLTRKLGVTAINAYRMRGLSQK